MIVFYFAFALLVIVADQLTKAWLVHTLPLYESREIIPGFFNLVHVTNTGAAFSMLADIDSPWRHYFFLGIGGAAVIGLTVGYFLYRDEQPGCAAAFGLIAGGAAGNLIDQNPAGGGGRLPRYPHRRPPLALLQCRRFRHLCGSRPVYRYYPG